MNIAYQLNTCKFTCISPESFPKLMQDMIWNITVSCKKGRPLFCCMLEFFYVLFVPYIRRRINSFQHERLRFYTHVVYYPYMPNNTKFYFFNIALKRFVVWYDWYGGTLTKSNWSLNKNIGVHHICKVKIMIFNADGR